jgi:hypothetical protein
MKTIGHRRVSVTPPPGVGTYIKGRTRYAARKDAWRLLEQIIGQDRGILARLAED